jgi:hypothetical protein
MRLLAMTSLPDMVTGPAELPDTPPPMPEPPEFAELAMVRSPPPAVMLLSVMVMAPTTLLPFPPPMPAP